MATLAALLIIPGMPQAQNTPDACNKTLVDSGVAYDIDHDDDGLIDICTLKQLHNVRFNPLGTSYKASASVQGVTTGCSSSGCKGYELMNDLDFDENNNGYTWMKNSDGSFRLDSGDKNTTYFDFTDTTVDNSDGTTTILSSGGWLPIGSEQPAFNAVFNGNGHTINGVATYRDQRSIGLFAQIGPESKIINLGLTGNLVANSGTDYSATTIGGLVGNQGAGSIIASWSTGDVYSGSGSGDRVGGLVGELSGNGIIIASYATGLVDGGPSVSDIVGGLVGYQAGGSITASYAMGNVDGGPGHAQRVGGLVGKQAGGSIIASYATGNANARNEDRDPREKSEAGALVGFQTPGVANGVIDSWGYGTPTGVTKNIIGNDRRPSGATTPAQLTAYAPGVSTAVPSSWNDAERKTLNAWGLGDATQNPFPKLSDYDGSGSDYHCANNPQDDSSARIIISYCGKRVSFEADNDSDGLIEIATLEELNNVRFSLKGAGYKSSDKETVNTSGCPSSGCKGYELIDDLSFDKNGNGYTWTRDESNGAITLDVGDNDNIYFNSVYSGGGWVPIGNCGVDNTCGRGNDDQQFLAIFEGNGHVINGLAFMRDLPAIGLFGIIGAGAEIRNLGLTGSLAVNSGATGSYIGSLVGYLADSAINASWSSGDVYGGSGDNDRAGGLVGHQGGGTVTGSHAAGNVHGGNGTGDFVGGLVGRQIGGSITDSHATANGHGGEGTADRVGGLVGHHQQGVITSSWASGNANGGGGGNDKVGGLLGFLNNGTVTASYATGTADGGAGSGDDVGGLVGHQTYGSITASYALVDADGGIGRSDCVGGLVGYQANTSAITASWAMGSADGGAGRSDIVGGLVGYQASSSSIAASWASVKADGGTGNDDYAGSWWASSMTAAPLSLPAGAMAATLGKMRASMAARMVMVWMTARPAPPAPLS